jgi:hypothetical protein
VNNFSSKKPVKIYLRHIETRQYYVSPGSWSVIPTYARTFPSAIAARDVAMAEGINNLEIVFRGAEAEHRAFPLPNASERTRRSM